MPSHDILQWTCLLGLRWISTIAYFFRAYTRKSSARNKETLFGRSLVYVKVEPHSTFTFTCGLRKRGRPFSTVTPGKLWNRLPLISVYVFKNNLYRHFLSFQQRHTQLPSFQFTIHYAVFRLFLFAPKFGRFSFHP